MFWVHCTLTHTHIRSLMCLYRPKTDKLNKNKKNFKCLNRNSENEQKIKTQRSMSSNFKISTFWFGNSLPINMKMKNIQQFTVSIRLFDDAKMECTRCRPKKKKKEQHSCMCQLFRDFSNWKCLHLWKELCLHPIKLQFCWLFFFSTLFSAVFNSIVWLGRESGIRYRFN